MRINKEVLTIKDEKKRYALYMSEETMQLAEENYRSDCCRSRSEFIKKRSCSTSGTSMRDVRSIISRA